MEYYVCRSEYDDKLKIEKIGDVIIFETYRGDIDSYEIHLNKNDITRMIEQLNKIKNGV